MITWGDVKAITYEISIRIRYRTALMMFRITKRLYSKLGYDLIVARKGHDIQ